MEFDLTKILDYGVAGIAIAILAVLFFIFKTFMNYIQSSDIRHATVQAKFIEAIDKQTEMQDKSIRSNQEIKHTLEGIGEYIKLKNGSMEKFIERTNEKLDACPNNIRRRK